MSERAPIRMPDALKALSMHDPGAVEALRTMRLELERRSELDVKSIELVRIGALMGLGAPSGSYEAHVRRAVEVGATRGEIWGAVMSVAPLVGVPRLMEAIPAISESLSASGAA